MHLAILVPIFDDWNCASPLLADLDAALGAAGHTADVVVVDDGSSQPIPDLPPLCAGLRAVTAVQVLELVRNLGHDRALAVGLCHVHEAAIGAAVVVMDADGEDPPAGIPSLLAAWQEHDAPVVVASRLRREEPLWFQAFYRCFRVAFRLGTGHRLDYGHYSLLTHRAAARLVHMNELWTSYTATLLTCRLPIRRVGIDRGRRYLGSSHMSIVGLIVHGMRAASVFIERIYVRLALVLVLLSTLAATIIVTAFTLKVIDLASPGWASNLIATSLVIVILTALLIVGGLLTILRGDQRLASPPISNWRQFVRGVHRAEPDQRPGSGTAVRSSTKA
jgi:hypothetical protein